MMYSKPNLFCTELRLSCIYRKQIFFPLQSYLIELVLIELRWRLAKTIDQVIFAVVDGYIF